MTFLFVLEEKSQKIDDHEVEPFGESCNADWNEPIHGILKGQRLWVSAWSAGVWFEIILFFDNNEVQRSENLRVIGGSVGDVVIRCCFDMFPTF